jgi:signal transduction histidine kinase
MLTPKQVLDLSRLESGKVELLSDIFDPSEIASKCLAMMSARIAEKKICERNKLTPSYFH